MQFQYSPYVLPLFAAAVISILVTIYVWPRRHTPGATVLALSALVIAEWSLSYALEIAGANLATKVFWGKSQYIGIVFAPYLWLRFALAYTSEGKTWNTRLLNGLIILPVTTLFLALTTEWHKLIWDDIFINQIGNLSVLGVTYGFWFWLHFASSYLFLFAGTAIILRALRYKQSLYQAQIFALLLAVLSPWIGNILYFSGFTPVPGLDLTPFAFTITVVALAWGIFGYRLGDIAPIARELIVENMLDGIMVVDRRGRVADMNNAAGRIIGVPSSQAIGELINDLFSPWPHLQKHLREDIAITDELILGEGAGQRRYEIQITHLYDQQERPLGQVITIHSYQPTAVPALRFASRNTALTSSSADTSSPEKKTLITNPILNWIINFILAPIKPDLEIPADVNPGWIQTLERAFTIILRIIAILGTLTILFTFPSMLMMARTVILTFGVIISLVWFLSLARNISFRFRTTLFLLLLYSLALIETINFGYSVESFTFFMAFIVLAALLAELRVSIVALLLGLGTMALWGWQIGSGNFIPLTFNTGSVSPPTIQAAISSLLTFAASAIAIMAAVIILLRSLNRAWQLETQALNLLSQERDLLEQRITERTQDLAKAHDQAVKSSLELQKYFLAIEQSGNGIFITDPNGNIEYVNPKFMELTGYSQAEVRGNNPRLLKSGEQTAEFYDTLWQTISAGEIWRGEMHNRRKDGSLYWQSATIAPVMNQAGQVTNYVAINEDITAQKQLQEQLQRQNKYLSILHQTTLDLLNRQSLDELLPAIVERACVLLDAPLGEIMLKEGDEMVVRAHTPNQYYQVGDRVDRHTARLTWQAHDTRQPVILENYSAWPDHRDIYNVNPLQAVADFPVTIRDTCIGVLALGRTKTGYSFSPEQIETGVLFAQLAALVLDNANLYDSALKEIAERKRIEHSLQQLNQEQHILTTILQIDIGQAPLEELLTTILDEILSVSWLNLKPQGGVFLLEGEKKFLTLKAHRNLDTQIQTLCHKVAVGQCLCGRAAATHQLQFAQHVDTRHEIRYDGMEDHGHYNIPILSGEKILGVIVLYLPAGYQKAERDIRFLRAVADTLAGILDRKQAEEQNRSFMADMKSLQEIHLLLSEIDDSQHLYTQMINLSQHRLGLDRVGLFLLDDPTHTLWGTYRVGSEGQVQDERHYQETVTANHWTVEIVQAPNHARLWENAPLYDNDQEMREGWKAAAALWNGHKAIGYLICDNFRTGKLPRPYEAELISLLGSTFGHLIERKRAEDRLAIARDQALEASRFKGQLLAKVSHELRTPLGAILGYTELLRDDIFGPLSSKQKQIANEVIDSTEYLTTLVGELLDEAQFEGNIAQLHLELFAPDSLLQQAEAKMAVLAQRKGLTFTTTLSPELPDMVYGDERRLQQMLINLLGNAIKFTKSGEVRASLYRPDAQHWAIEVTDTGRGIPQEAQSYIFEPFRQVDGSITREHGGTGLGLSIVKQLTDLMKGRITLISEVGHGSTFTILLPLLTQQDLTE